MSELKDKDEQYSVFLKYQENSEKQERRKLAILRLIFSLLVFGVLISAVVFVVNNYSMIASVLESMTDKNIAGVKASSKPDLTPAKFNFKMLSRYQNILLLGVDSNGPDTLPFTGVRSDTMIILSIDLKNKSVNAVSIPRDSKVYLAEEHGIQKINAAYAFGGIELTKKTIEETFGVRIHNYVIINAEGVRKIIDALGGVPIYVDQDLRYHDYSGKLHIDLKKGEHILNGEQAEGYVRFRKDYLGDIGRVNRQQKFIKALAERIKSPDAIKKIPEALKIANLYTRTDLNLYQMSQYAAIARDIDMNKVEFVMLPGAPNRKGMISYWILDPDETQSVINRLIYRQKSTLDAEDISVGLVFPKTDEIAAMEVKEQLKEAGYRVNCTSRQKNVEKSEIIGYNTAVSKSLINDLKDKVPSISHHGFTHQPVRTYCNSSDVVITIKNEDDN